MKNNRVLVISHNAFSTTNNMGKTLVSLFHDFKNNEIAQLYFHSFKPDIDKCSSWFQITDFDVLKSIVDRKECGNITTLNQNESQDYKDNSQALIYRIGKDHSSAKLLLRDLVWKIGRWNTENLYKWVESFNPTHIFFASGYSMFAYDVALTISRKYDIPLITYFCDDYYHENIKNLSPLYYVRKVLFKAKVNEIVKQSRDLVFISESMQKQYFQTFNINGHTILTPYLNSLEKKKSKNGIEFPIKISYIGNVLLGRWELLVEIAKCISRINKKDNYIDFEVYSANASEQIIQALKIDGVNYYKGNLSSDKVKKKMIESDILLHVESFENQYIEKTRHSFSTKIADYLASGRYILAVGPDEVFSLKYLKNSEVAYIINDEDYIEKKIRDFFIENKLKDRYLTKALNLAEKNHNINENSKRLKNIIREILVDGRETNENSTS